MGSSYYVKEAHPPDMDDISEDAIFEEIVRDITVGVGSTGIRSGIIGEVGCSYPLSDNERKVLRASARAQQGDGGGDSDSSGTRRAFAGGDHRGHRGRRGRSGDEPSSAISIGR